MFARIRSRSSLRVAVAAGIAGVLSLSLVGSIELPRSDSAEPGPAGPARLSIGELPERRTATSATRRNPDGSMTTTVFGGPVNYRAGDGSWQPIDVTLHKINEGGYAWRSGANAFEARFRGSAEPGLVEFRVGGRTFRMTAEGAASGAAARVDGSAIAYPAAFAGAGLRYEVASTGVKETIELAGADSPTSFTFRLSAVDDGAAPTVLARPDGSYAVVAAPLPGAAFVLEAPTVQEAAGEHEVSLPAAAAKPTLRVSVDGRDLVATLSLDEGWLKAPGRRFPVRLDPTMSIQPDAEDASFITLPNYLPFVSDRLYIGTGTDSWRAALRC